MPATSVFSLSVSVDRYTFFCSPVNKRCRFHNFFRSYFKRRDDSRRVLTRVRSPNFKVSTKESRRDASALPIVGRLAGQFSRKDRRRSIVVRVRLRSQRAAASEKRPVLRHYQRFQLFKKRHRWPGEGPRSFEKSTVSNSCWLRISKRTRVVKSLGHGPLVASSFILSTPARPVASLFASSLSRPVLRHVSLLPRIR